MNISIHQYYPWEFVPGMRLGRKLALAPVLPSVCRLRGPSARMEKTSASAVVVVVVGLQLILVLAFAFVLIVVVVVQVVVFVVISEVQIIRHIKICITH